MRQAYYAASVLALVQMCAQLNIGVLTLLVGPVKRDLHLTDLQLSYLLGFSTVLFYVLVGIPAARLVDRLNRKWLMTGAVLIWSLMTGLCGAAQNFWQFFAARFGIGAGESINGPLSYSLLADYFPPDKLPRGMAIYSAGYTGGIGVSLLLGAFMIHILNGLPTIELPLLGVVRDWQAVLLLTGLLGLPIALLVARLREPKRRGLGLPVLGSKHRGATLREVLLYLCRNWRLYGPIFLGLSLTSLHMAGIGVWSAAFYGRTYQWEPAKVGLYSGLVNLGLMLPSLTGAILVNDLFRKRGHADTNMRVIAIGYSLAAPMMVLSPLMPSAWLALAVNGLGAAFMTLSVPSLNSAIQVITPNEMRGQLTALYLFIIFAVGAGLGPTYIAFMTEVVWGDASLLRFAISTSAAILFPAAALLYWIGIRPYREKILQMRAAGAPI
jgi:MFS family permease